LPPAIDFLVALPFFPPWLVFVYDERHLTVCLSFHVRAPSRPQADGSKLCTHDAR